MGADLGHGTATKGNRNSRAFVVLKTTVVDIVGVRLDAPPDVSAALWQLLSRDEREHAGKFRYAEHRRHYKSPPFWVLFHEARPTHWVRFVKSGYKSTERTLQNEANLYSETPSAGILAAAERQSLTP
jgi:hypothetical protein